jgi:RHH-type proline utilization regulon transcriptional repressor/proline dehydrogenase/delta 1-pyrroline-5-carboxylate dehydrogenase
MPSLFDPAALLRNIAALYRADESECIERLLPAAQLSPVEQPKAVARATRWIEDIRNHHRPQASVTDLLSRFGLTSQEGLALMCLAEALLRIPDRATADALIRDKLGSRPVRGGDQAETEKSWNEALGGADTPWAINATGWALAITGKIIQLDDTGFTSPGATLGKLASKLGQPMIREAIRMAMQWLADQFVMGETTGSALERSALPADQGVRFSFDMLGEGARSAADAEHYYEAYSSAIDAIGQFQAARKFKRASGISVKLSALHPRYEMAQRDRVLRELMPRLAALCEQAARHDIPLTVDAEEADRLQLSLEVAESLLRHSSLREWEGLGFAVQAYQKRAPAVIDFIAGLGKLHNRRLGIRLVKGAYWDSEIKRAQERGWNDFPVFTRKEATDVSYLACARQMLAASDWINPVFGTHNAMTAAHILELTRDQRRIEFQRLHGMGEELYRLIQKEGIGTCVYAPVGNHDVLLGYLVRRILENGANSSFVHRLFDRSVPVDKLVEDPAATLQSYAPQFRHPAIRMPPDLYGSTRRNSEGLDLSDPFVSDPLLAEIEKFKPKFYRAFPLIEGKENGPARAVIEPAFDAAQQAFADWSQWPVDKRATCLERLGDLLEQNRAELMALIIREGGKSIPDALGEVREAVDFCRYYAMRAREDFKIVELPGPAGERNRMQLFGRGVFVCISPWNFPLAIFLGQVVAALVAGNCVIAKPAPQTPLVALCAGKLIIEAGVPPGAFALIPGGPDIGTAIIEHPAVAGVAFTGSCATARTINIALANKPGPIVPLIAETGGQNAMIVDSSALPEQVVDDVITSAFRSAGQRCSALRILCLPEATADKILLMLKGAMRELRIGDPGKLETDVGPVIDDVAQQRLLAHIARLRDEAKEIVSVVPEEIKAKGAFVVPQAWEIPSIDWLKGEVFGPILHVVRYRPSAIDKLIEAINATGFGLTGGVHSRIESTVNHVERGLHVGNLYINRSTIGAVVGAQPFGGEGLSGTGPKAGGPHYLLRFAVERVSSNNLTAAGGNASLLIATSA